MSAPLPQLTVRPVGEGRVWFVACGLTIGLAMVALLLGTVAWNGLSVFWPRDLEQMKVDGQEMVAIRLDERDKVGGGREILLYTGNKDVYSLGFRWVDLHKISDSSLPKDLLQIERAKDGNALVRPLRFVGADGTVIAATEPDFRPAVDRAIDRVDVLRSRIKDIEHDQIGDNAADLEELKLERDVGRGRGTLSPEREAEIAAAIASLEESYAAYDVTRRDLRDQAEVERLEVEVVGSGQRTISFGNIIDVHAPNDMGFFARFWRFLHNLWSFAFSEPRESNTEGGIFPAIVGTFVMTLLMSAAVMPLGVVAAIYLREYARQGPLVRAVRIAINNLAGVPSIVFGVFGLGFFIYFLGDRIDHWFFADRLEFRNAPTFGTGGILWGALTLALMTVPVVIVATEEAIAAVPRGMREGSLALGSSKWQMMQRIVLPGAIPGILTGLILAMARGAGEVAPLMLVGVIKHVEDLPVSWDFPFVHATNKFMHLGFHIYDLGFQSPDSDAARPMVYATTLLLIGLVLVLNLSAILLRERIRRRMTTAAF